MLADGRGLFHSDLPDGSQMSSGALAKKKMLERGQETDLEGSLCRAVAVALA